MLSWMLILGEWVFLRRFTSWLKVMETRRWLLVVVLVRGSGAGSRSGFVRIARTKGFFFAVFSLPVESKGGMVFPRNKVAFAELCGCGDKYCFEDAPLLSFVAALKTLTICMTDLILFFIVFTFAVESLFAQPNFWATNFSLLLAAELEVRGVCGVCLPRVLAYWLKMWMWLFSPRTDERSSILFYYFLL